MQLSVHPISLANPKCEYYHGFTHKQLIAMEQRDRARYYADRDRWSYWGIVYAKCGFAPGWTPKF